MKRIIYGLTDLADVLFYELNAAGIEVDSFCVNEKYKIEDRHRGKPVITYENLESIYNKEEEIGIYLCIGYHSMNRIREKIFKELKSKNRKILSFVHESAIVMAEQMGEGCLVFEHAVIGPYTKIGNANIFYPKSMVSHHSVVGDFNFFAISSSVAGNVRVENNCFIGNNATTKDGITIQSFTLAGAGCYVSSDTKEGSCVVPAPSVELDKHTSFDFM